MASEKRREARMYASLKEEFGRGIEGSGRRIIGEKVNGLLVVDFDVGHFDSNSFWAGGK